MSVFRGVVVNGVVGAMCLVILDFVNGVQGAALSSGQGLTKEPYQLVRNLSAFSSTFSLVLASRRSPLPGEIPGIRCNDRGDRPKASHRASGRSLSLGARPRLTATYQRPSSNALESR